VRVEFERGETLLQAAEVSRPRLAGRAAAGHVVYWQPVHQSL